MALIQRQYEDILRYLDSQMTTDEQKIFLLEVEQDIALKESLELEKQIRNSDELWSRHADADRIKSIVEKARYEWQSQRGKKGKWVILYAKLAAACIVIGLAIFFSYELTSKRDDEKSIGSLVKDTSMSKTQDVPLIKSLSRQGKLDSNLAAIYKKNYKKFRPPKDDIEKEDQAVTELKREFADGENMQLQSLNEEDVVSSTKGIGSKGKVLDALHFYKGLSYIETGNNNAAVIELNHVLLTSPDDQLKDHAAWYLGLLYFKTGNNESAILTFTRITRNPKNIYYKRANEILNEIKR